jgi:glucosamine kinase
MKDAVAMDIVMAAARSIAESLDALLWPECPSICLLGGLAHAYRPWLDERHKAILAEPKGDVLRGAVELAAKLLRGGEENRG